MSSVRVRMYRQGLGDCFLVTFDPEGPKPAHLLIDCGVLKGTEDANTEMARVAHNISETTGGRLDVLVATHEHWDHVSGFLQAEDVFKELEVGQVWVAWTENPEDELANELRTRKAHALRALVAAKRQLAAAGSTPLSETAEQITRLLDFHGDFSAAEGRPTTAKALDWVKDRDAPIHFLRPGEARSAFGVRVYVLGPPHERAAIKRSDPSKKASEVYELAGEAGADSGFFAAAADEGTELAEPHQPFESRYRLSDEDVRAEPLIRKSYLSKKESWRRIDHDWLSVAGRLALQLDSDTNNTSLVLAFELSPDGSVLLFPGDAQVGNWLSWESLKWTNGDGAKVTAADLLARTVLYKVGHHGSHNATLREKGLELMSSAELVAMVPVNRVMAKKMEWNMPFPPLFSRLHEKTKGRIIDAQLGVAAERPDELSAARWKRFRDRVDQQDHWIDYTIEF